MEVSMWSYPWDFLDCGLENALDELKDAGFNGVSMITSYHAGRFLCVRSPKRKVYFPEDGVLYYPSDLKRFEGQRIQPVVGKFIKEQMDFWPRLFEESRKRGMQVNGWTVCLHNTRLGMQYSDVCVHNAYDDVVYYNQCPSNPDVRLYMRTLLDDLLSHVPLDRVELESMNYMGHAHEFHHEKDGIGLTPLQDFLFSLCFCSSCQERARRERLNIMPAKLRVRDWLDQICEGSFRADETAFLALGLEYFKPWPEVYDYLQWRSSVVTSLVQEVHEATAGRTKLFFLSLLPHSGSWLFGVDLKKITEYCEGVVVCSYDCDEYRAEKDIRECKKDFAAGTDLILGMRCFTPEYSGKEAFMRKVETGVCEGVDGFNFYNYGLIPKERLYWAKAAIGL